MKKKTISEKTKEAILEGAWKLITEQGRLNVSQAEIAAEAGVSRQTVFYAFGGRTELLIAMVRHKDEGSKHVERMRAWAEDTKDHPHVLLEMVESWLSYLPEIYPVGILLDAASSTDAEARAAWEDRMVHTLLKGFRRVVRRLIKAGHLEGDAGQIADEIWCLCHPTAWRLLVVERGWSAEAFRASRRRHLCRLLGLDERSSAGS